MRTFRILAALMMAVVCVSLSSCSKDDDSKDSIVGKWKLVNTNGAIGTHVEYSSNGTFKYTSTNKPSYEEHGKYKIDGTKLYEMFSDEDEWFVSEIVLLNSTTLTLQELEDDGVTPDGKPYSYQRVE